MGKCALNHAGAYGYPARPDERYDFCSECGTPLVWECGSCHTPLPEDAEELERARFCRDCGAPYFDDEPPHEAAGRTG